MEIEKELKEILQILNYHGKGYIVGGYVRDKLLEIKPKDCDFCTNISYEKLLNIFKEYSPKEIGKAFGIVQIKYKKKFYEIAKLRKDIEFTNDRNKVGIEFIEDIYEDLRRRDFTVNAIAFTGKELIYVSDYAKEDIKNRVIRFVGNGEKRIEEDPLRILRGIRIATEKKLFLTKETEKNILSKRETLKNVSIERVQEELFKIFKSKRCYWGVEKLVSLKIFEIILPKVQVALELDKELEKLENFSGEINLILIYFFLKTNGENLDNLKLEKKLKVEIERTIESYDRVDNLNTLYEIRKFLNIYGKDILKNILKIKSTKENNKVEKIKIKLEKIIKNKDVINIRDLEIKGNDLIELGVKQGPKVKLILDEIMDIVLKDPTFNNKELLIEKAKEML